MEFWTRRGAPAGGVRNKKGAVSFLVKRRMHNTAMKLGLDGATRPVFLSPLRGWSRVRFHGLERNSQAVRSGIFGGVHSAPDAIIGCAGRRSVGARYSPHFFKPRMLVLVALVLSAYPSLPGWTAEAQTFRVLGAVRKTEVFVGESFVFQVQIEGSDKPEKPDVSAIADFKVREMGGQQNTSQSMTIVNGRVNQVVRRGYVFSYRLTPRRAGTLRIPALTVSAEGKTASTAPIAIRVAPPVESDDFKLRMSLSERKAYVGQPVTLKVTWYVGKDVREFSLDIPVLKDERFRVAGSDPKVTQAQAENYVRVPLADGEVIGKKGRGTLDGRDYLTVSFERMLIPRQAGKLRLPQAAATCQAQSGRRERRRGVLDDFFSEDFFRLRSRAVYETAVAPSNRPRLDVLDLPARGRPPGFSGLVGKYSIAAEATPNEVNVGDPITLTVKISGPRYLGNVDLPALSAQPALARAFKIPSERSPGTVKGRAKVFTQTLRARHAEVAGIPPIELSYFDVESGRYQRATTEPIPLTVNIARIVTVRDAEGLADPGTVQTELETLEGGIAHNYEDFDALESQTYGPTAWLASPLWATLIFVPPLAYGGLFAFVVVAKKRYGDPRQRRAREAFKKLKKALDGAEEIAPGDDARADAALLEAVRHYLGDRLGLASGALTFADAERELSARGVSPEISAEWSKLFERREAGRYAGGGLSGATGETARAIRSASERTEQELR